MAEVVSGSLNTSSIDKGLVLRWRQRLRRSGVLTLVCEWREADSAERYRGGRKPTIDDEVILTLMLVLVAERSALKGTILGHALGHRLTNAAKEALGISHLFDGTTRNWNQLARRAVRRLTKTWDAWGGGRKCAIGRLEREKLEEDLAENEDFVEEMMSRGDKFTCALIQMTLEELPRSVRRQNTVALTVDQTALEAVSQLAPWRRDTNGLEKFERYADMDPEDPESEVERVVLEPQAGLYPVEKGAAVKDSAGVTTWVASDWQMAFMGNVMLGVYEDPSADNTLAPPQLAYAGSLSAPNKRIGEHTIALVDIIMGRGTKISRLSFDKGYTQLTVEKFHRPLRERGIKVVKDYKGGKVGGQKGITNGFGGAHFVEGDWYCASTPKELLEATIRYDDGLITVEEYWRDIDLRQAYKLHIKDHNPNPSSVKYQCPAMGDSATVDCPLRTMTKKALQKDNLAPINESQILERDVDICCKKSLNIPIAESEKESGQKYGYATRAHNRVYKADRASSESANDFLHNDASVLSDPTNRPMRGLAVAQLAWALMLVAFNMTRIAQYMHERFKLEQKNLAIKLRTGITVPMPKPGARRRPPKRLRDRNDRSHYRRGYKARPTVVVSRT
ncbi:hypothetical protein [Frondihabitans australicus]|nr:hypothetical protein [Frondihabitans australicus]